MNFLTFGDFLEKYGFYISLTIASLIVVLLIIFFVVPRLHKEAPEIVESSVNKDAFYALLGGEDNIKTISLKGSRLSVELFDLGRADLEALKKHGVDRVIVMQNKLVLLVNEAIKALFNELP